MITVFDWIRNGLRTIRFPSVHVHSDKRSFFINTKTWAEQAVSPHSRIQVNSSLIDHFSLCGGDLAKSTIYSWENELVLST
jgi:hypothetical protein